MKPQWPTLEGRLKHAPTSRLAALKQMKANGDQLTPLAERVLLKELKKELQQQPCITKTKQGRKELLSLRSIPKPICH